MSSLQSVILQGVVYVGGGVSLTDDCHTRIVYKYRMQENEWVKLEEYKYVWFAMAVFDNKLTVVGGYDTSTEKVTNEIAVWETRGVSHQWIHPYSPMPTHRHSPAVATYKQWLVVAGGVHKVADDHTDDLVTVELFNSHDHQWQSTAPLPVKCRHMTSAIVQHKLFLIGGTLAKRALVVPLDDITTPTKTSTEWCYLPETPLEYSAAIALEHRGSLLIVGGRLGNDYSTAIHIYQSDTKQWSKIGDLPTARSSCSCTLLPSGEILVVGGRQTPVVRTKRVDAVTIALSPEHV